MRLPRGPKRPDNPFEREPQEINDEDVKPEGKDFLPHFERYAPPTEDWDEIQERTRQQREMEGIVQEAERPIATLQRGGRPPDFVTVESEGTLIGELGALRHRIRNFHVLDAIEYEVNKATGPDDLRRIVDKYIYAQPGVYNPNELIVVSEKPKFPPNLDPEGELRWKIYNEAVERLAKKKPVIVENTTLVAPAVDVESDKQGKKRRRRCDNKPSVIPLPISWPGELPRPYYSPRTLIRTSKGDREFEGTDRGVEQRKFADEIKYAREKGVPPPDPFYPRDSYENSPFDAHHIHPLYLGGEDARFNLCALRTDLHQIGHPRLDDQESWLEEYLEQGICYGHLKDHPIGQTYTIRKRK
jgi:hypothetical protein